MEQFLQSNHPLQTNVKQDTIFGNIYSYVCEGTCHYGCLGGRGLLLLLRLLPHFPVVARQYFRHSEPHCCVLETASNAGGGRSGSWGINLPGRKWRSTYLAYHHCATHYYSRDFPTPREGYGDKKRVIGGQTEPLPDNYQNTAHPRDDPASLARLSHRSPGTASGKSKLATSSTSTSMLLTPLLCLGGRAGRV